jgi:hypothetical protein
MPDVHFVTVENVFTKKNLWFFELSRSLSEKQHGSHIDPLAPTYCYVKSASTRNRKNVFIQTTLASTIYPKK